MPLPLAKRWALEENRFYRRLAFVAKVISMAYLGILAFLMLSETRLVFPGPMLIGATGHIRDRVGGN